LQKEPEKEDWSFNMDNNFKELSETVIEIKRISKKTKGGNTIRFSALVVVGDKKGKVGLGLAKASDVSGAIQKSIAAAKRRMFLAPLKGTTVPYSVKEKYSAAKILIKPAPKGSGIIAGGAIRVVLEAAGITDAVGKILGTKNKASNVNATLNALKRLAYFKEIKRMKGEL
jgi:small subunit ribosomal protein S5